MKSTKILLSEFDAARDAVQKRCVEIARREPYTDADEAEFAACDKRLNKEFGEASQRLKDEVLAALKGCRK